MIRLYAANTRDLGDPNRFAQLLETVPDTRREKIHRLRKEEDKCRSLGAWLLLVHGLGQAGIAPGDIRLTEGDAGKPSLTNYPDVHFNLSHSGERVFCAVSGREVGCDVEQMGSVDLAIARRFFTPLETALLTEIPGAESQRQMFFRLWTLKESFLKAVGRGMTLPLRDFSIGITTEGAVLERNPFPERVFFLREWDFGDGYRYACCGEEAEFAPVEWVRLG